MIPDFTADGLLPPGVHWATWEEIQERFGASGHRRSLLRGLRRALVALKDAGCERVYLNGSFVTTKTTPGDYDACWDLAGVDVDRLDPVFRQFDWNGRAAQKAKYEGEFLISDFMEARSGLIFVEFFQTDRDSGDVKGIVAIDLRSFE
jgi:hypothetical protein